MTTVNRYGPMGDVELWTPHTRETNVEPPTVTDADYEQMYHLLYAYRFGSISFLELLDKFEEILHIDASQARR